MVQKSGRAGACRCAEQPWVPCTQVVKQDSKEAVEWYRKAAVQGFAIAQYNLGTMYANGLGVRQDVANALKWWQQSKDKNMRSSTSTSCSNQQLISSHNTTARHRRHYDLADLCSWLKARQQTRHCSDTNGRNRRQARPGCGAARGCSNPNLVLADEPPCLKCSVLLRQHHHGSSWS